MMRDFRASVSADLDEVHRRLDGMDQRIGGPGGEIRDRFGQTDERIRILETAILNEIRALGGPAPATTGSAASKPRSWRLAIAASEPAATATTTAKQSPKATKAVGRPSARRSRS